MTTNTRLHPHLLRPTRNLILESPGGLGPGILGLDLKAQGRLDDRFSWHSEPGGITARQVD